MAKDLKLIANSNVDADFLNGQVTDNTGSGNGTVAGKEVHGDGVEFFQKLMIDAGITANDLYDNVSNGHQYIEALVAKVNSIVPDTATASSGHNYIGQTTVLPLQSGWSAVASEALWNRERGGMIVVSARITRTSASPISITTTPLPIVPIASGKILDISDATLQIKYPFGLSQKYFKCTNETTGLDVTICINSAHEVFIAKGDVNLNDTLNMQFTFF